MKRFSTVLTALALTLSGTMASAQAPALQGSTSSIFTCFYECKPSPGNLSGVAWREVTTLMLANQNVVADQVVGALNPPIVFPPGPTSSDPAIQVNETLVNLRAQMFFIDGNQNVIATAGTILSPLDLDEVNVCRTLQAAGIEPPSAGLVQVLVFDDQKLNATLDGSLAVEVSLDGLGAYGWIKNIVGKFGKQVDEPFDGLVEAVAKTTCREGPPEVSVRDAIGALRAILDNQPAPPAEIAPILIENTAEPDPADRIILQLFP